MALDQTTRVVSARKSPMTATRTGIDWKWWTQGSCSIERFEEVFDRAVPFRLGDDGRRRFDAKKTDLVLEIVAHKLRAGIISELQSGRGADS